MDKVQTIVIFSFFMPLLLGVGFAWFIVQYSKRKNEYFVEMQKRELKEKEILIKHKEDIEKERDRIAAEMHDDLGGGLTLIKHLAHMSSRAKEDSKNQAYLKEIMSTSGELTTNMSEIIWALNSGNDTCQNLIEYITQYSENYLGKFDINLSLDVSKVSNNKTKTISARIRRNTFLIIKELLHNVVKHAEATEVKLKIHENNEAVNFVVHDNGKGFDLNNRAKGHGVENLKKRASGINSTIDFKTDRGTSVSLSLPLI